MNKKNNSNDIFALIMAFIAYIIYKVFKIITEQGETNLSDKQQSASLFDSKLMRLILYSNMYFFNVCLYGKILYDIIYPITDLFDSEGNVQLQKHLETASRHDDYGGNLFTIICIVLFIIIVITVLNRFTAKLINNSKTEKDRIFWGNFYIIVLLIYDLTISFLACSTVPFLK